MEIAFLIVSLVAVVLVGTALSERLRVPAPLFLTGLGIAASFIPGMPQVHLHPEVVLIGLLPPLLYTAALNTSLVDFRTHQRPILVLSIALVVVTTFTTGAVVKLVLPSLPWAAALAIGAVVAPPDAVAATAVAKRIGLPRDVVAILEGESLLNDATALVALRTAIAALSGTVALADIGVDFVIAAGGGLVVGLLVFVVLAWAHRRLRDPLLSTGISFLTPFVAYLAAEEVHASGVIAVVVAGLLLGHKSYRLHTAQARLTEAVTWRTISFILEHAVFLLIGLQARWLLEDLQASEVPLPRIVAVCLAALATVVATRLAWVFGSRLWLLTPRARASLIPARHAALIGWAGMRGVVTLAAAFVIPVQTPYRNVLLVIAFTVVAGTLLIQGLSLPWVTRRLQVSGPDPAEDALARATVLQAAGQAGLDALDRLDLSASPGVETMIRARVDQRTFAAWERLATSGNTEPPSAAYARVRGEMITAERTRVLEIRDQGRVPADVVREVLGMLDFEESMIDAGAGEQQDIRATATNRASAGCAELTAYPAVVTVSDPVCAQCVAEGLTPVALRQCLVCGHIGCCDSSPGQHATGHFEDSGHPVMQSAEAEETWRWCYVHHLTA